MKAPKYSTSSIFFCLLFVRIIIDLPRGPINDSPYEGGYCVFEVGCKVYILKYVLGRPDLDLFGAHLFSALLGHN